MRRSSLLTALVLAIAGLSSVQAQAAPVLDQSHLGEFLAFGLIGAGENDPFGDPRAAQTFTVGVAGAG